jgi:hypothetical protein
MKGRRRIGGPAKRAPVHGERAALSIRIAPILKRRLDAAAEEGGRSQSQEAEIRLASSFEREDMLDQVFAKAVEVSVMLLDPSCGGGEHLMAAQSWLRGSVQTKGDTNGNQFVFILEHDTDEAVVRDAKTNIPYKDESHSSTTCTLAEYRYLARKNRLRLVSPSQAAMTAADAALRLTKSSRRPPSREELAEVIKRELLASGTRSREELQL